ncbi:23530_t:CDS:2 [Gigaspora rosea]|nr:23530_t:CDS:2 [Gigaspora rosea]
MVDGLINKYILYSYFLGNFSEDRSFYASLRTETFQQNQERLLSSDAPNENLDEATEYENFDESTEELNREGEDTGNISTFLEEIKADYENSSSQLRIALDKFAERYRRAKSMSIPWLVSFLYELNRNSNAAVNVRSGSAIRVQPRSGSEKRNLSAINKENEDLDSHVIPCRKKKKAGKKEHNLSRHVMANQQN